ncbi:uncharacterized protein LOC117555511 [Gymnodraco acuticeps]|uniref:ribonuclease H n=1 Tax=Gymnodraco acuticeps TaxID=8218 RepID=A0A6P8VKN2_GYMAC|nr:uncharacterized protein LOC117555511 [Gymnodraco acuticeps]
MSTTEGSDNEAFPQDLDPDSDIPPGVSSISSSQWRTSSRLASRGESRTAEADFLISHLRRQGISAAPDLPLSQLRKLSDQVPGAASQPRAAAPANSPANSPERPERGRGRSRGGKRTRKRSPPQARPEKKRKSNFPQSHPSAGQLGSLGNQDDSLANTLKNLASSMRGINAHLQAMDKGSARASTSSANWGDAPAQGLRPGQGQLRAKILERKDVNLVSLILPSPECDKSIATGGSFTAVFRSTDPRLLKDLHIGQFLVAFGIFRDVLCTVYPERRTELDAYLGIIGDLQLKYGKSIFYYYHKSFSSKAARHLAHCNIRLDWSVLDTELLVMATGGQQVHSCSTCGTQGHTATFCPSVPLSRARDFPTPYPGNDGQERQLLRGCASEVSLPQAPPNQLPATETTWWKDLLKIHPSTPINIPYLAAALSTHPDSVFVDYLLSGLSQGFRVGVLSAPPVTFVAKNLQSANKEPIIVSQLIEKECNKGYLIGPFHSSPFSVFRTSPIGVATRKYSEKKRLIFDLSAPRAGPFCSFYSLIPSEPFSLQYASVDDAIKLIKLTGQGAWLSKADITDAFKIIPIHPSQWNMFGIRWESKFYFAVRLTFGCRSSPCIFNSLSEALCSILLNIVRIPSVLHLLDDFLLVDPPRDNSGASLAKLKLCFQKLGVPLSAEKTLGPDTRLEFLGITLDSAEMKASLPSDKLQRIRDITKSYCGQQTITKQQLLSLLGHLNFAMRVIPQGRSFISRLLDTASGVKNLHDRVVLDEGFRSDLRFWSLLLDHWNGITFFYDDIVYSSDSMRLFTDAAPSVGFGGLFQGEWFAGPWPPTFPNHASSSALHEIYPIAVACYVWGHLWLRKRISVLCDNQAVVGIINKARSPCNDIMPFMRSITWSSITHNFLISARHVPGYLNTAADSLSRLSFHASHFSLKLKHSKCGGACSASAARNDSPFCPYKSMIKFLHLRSSTNPLSPLFLLPGNIPLTKHRFNYYLKQILSKSGLSPQLFSGHSFRIGAATSAAIQGVSSSSLQQLGRWSSSAFTSYIRPDISAVLAIQRSLKH